MLKRGMRNNIMWFFVFFIVTDLAVQYFRFESINILNTFWNIVLFIIPAVLVFWIFKKKE